VKGEVECSPVDRVYQFSVQIKTCLDCLLRHHVDLGPATVIGSTLEKGHIKGAILAADFSKVV
jgi:hypothetical protein